MVDSSVDRVTGALSRFSCDKKGHEFESHQEVIFYYDF